MYQNMTTKKWTLIGTLHGGGYDCRSGKIFGNGTWNRIIPNLAWIKEQLEDLKQQACSDHI